MRPSNSSGQISGQPWDVVVVGAGAAGLMACLELPGTLKVLLLNRNTSRSSSSRWAQGGIASVTRPEDSIQSHAHDTISAGAGLCDGGAVRFLVERAPKCVEHLQGLGMQFDRESEVLATTLEAAHTHRRVLHVQDQTGRALVEVLEDQVDQRSNLVHRRGVRVTQLWVENKRCCGVQVLDGPHLHWISARAVVLATGGGGHLFANTTNPAQACGEGIALAWEAGALIEDLEFVQFHPTALKLEGAPCFLLSEALRGEGALLVDGDSRSPVEHLGGRDLAPRDQVSRALLHAMRLQNATHMGLDLRTIPRESVELRFPMILQRCREFGLDPFTNPIPVAPAAHYWMGGIATDLNAATSLKGLFAVGEVACTGLHGANRLASNSLMECLVFARQMAFIELTNVSDLLDKNCKVDMSPVDCSLDLSSSYTSSALIRAIDKLRKLCWLEAGVQRSPRQMQDALTLIKSDLALISEEPLLVFANNQPKEKLHRLSENSRRSLNLLLDLSNRLLVSLLLFKACLFRCESRGGHFRIDAPSQMPFWQAHSCQTLGKELFTRPVRT